jgi:hypothetical protein
LEASLNEDEIRESNSKDRDFYSITLPNDQETEELHQVHSPTDATFECAFIFREDTEFYIDECMVENQSLTSRTVSVQCSPLVFDKETQTEAQVTCQVSTPAKARANFTYSVVSEKDFSYLTGLRSYGVMKKIHDFIIHNGFFGDSSKLPVSEHLLSSLNQCFLIFMRLRMGLTLRCCGIIFGISLASTGRVFDCWIRKFYYVFSQINLWQPTEIVKETMPESLKKFSSDVICMLDATEFRSQLASDTEAAKKMFSFYKAWCTWKLLTGLSPGGYLMFISHLYSGCSSDKLTLTSSGILDRCNPGDVLLCDRGFMANEQTEQRGIKIQTPAFLERGRDQFNPTQLSESYVNAHNRVKVENHNRMIKEYRILKEIPISMHQTADKIVFCCAFFTLFRPPIITQINEPPLVNDTIPFDVNNISPHSSPEPLPRDIDSLNSSDNELIEMFANLESSDELDSSDNELIDLVTKINELDC